MTHDYKKKKVKGNGYNHIWTKEKLEKLGDELIEFCRNDESMHLADFTYKYKKPREWLYNLAEKHEILKEKLELARQMMSAKMGNACYRNKEINSNFGEKYLPIYDSEYKAMLQWKEDIKKRELSEKEANLIVNAVKFTQKANDDNEDD